MSDQPIRMVDSLPPLRAFALMLRAFAQADQTADLRPLIGILVKEPGVTARVIAVANSAYYAPARPVGSVQDAAAILGIRALKTVVLGVVLNAHFDPSRCPGFRIDRFWTDAFMTAVSTGYVVDSLFEPPPVDRHTLYTLGLVQSLGLLLLADQVPEGLARAIEHSESGQIRLLDAEREVLSGLDHYNVGAQLLDHWGLPALFSVTLRDLGLEKGVAEIPQEPVTAILAVAKGLVSHLSHGGAIPRPIIPATSPQEFVDRVRDDYHREQELASRLAQMLHLP